MGKNEQQHGLTYCRPDFKAPNLQKQNRCPDCGFKKRGVNHAEGIHCKQGKNARTGGVLVKRR